MSDGPPIPLKRRKGCRHIGANLGLRTNVCSDPGADAKDSGVGSSGLEPSLAEELMLKVVFRGTSEMIPSVHARRGLLSTGLCDWMNVYSQNSPNF